MIYGTYPAVITKEAYDGDTVWVNLNLLSSKGIVMPLDLGFGITLDFKNNINLECRLYGINAPEINIPAQNVAALEARAYLRSLIPVGTAVKIDSYNWDKYAPRFDGVICLQDGTNVNQKMVDSGHAVKYP
jgi:endonuclease YncB( thermonuclease family)